MTGIAAWNEQGIDARQFRKNLAPFAKRKLDGFRVGIVLVHCRVPDPDIEPVGIGEPRHVDHHLHGRTGKMRAVGVVVRARRDQFDGVATKHGQVAKILFPGWKVPGVVGMGFGPVAELVSAQRIFRRGDDLQIIRDRHAAALHAKLAQQSADAKQHAAGIVADDENVGVRLARFDQELKTFGGIRAARGREPPGAGLREWFQCGSVSNQNDRRIGSRPYVQARPAQV